MYLVCGEWKGVIREISVNYWLENITTGQSTQPYIYTSTRDQY